MRHRASEKVREAGVDQPEAQLTRREPVTAPRLPPKSAQTDKASAGRLSMNRQDSASFVLLVVLCA